MLAGREFAERDDAGSPRVAVISETMARRRFPGENPVGQILTLSDGIEREIVEWRDVRYGNVKDAPRDVVYLPMFQPTGKNFRIVPSFELRYAAGEKVIRRLVQAAVARWAPGLPLYRMKTLEVQTRESLARERLLALLTTYFGAFALLLACIGLYGLMSYVVTRRPELGLRMALGARPGLVQWLVVRESAFTVLAGLGVGIGGAAAAVGLVRTQLFGVDPVDPVTFAAATTLLLLLSVAAAYLPAWRASRIDPVSALRNE